MCGGHEKCPPCSLLIIYKKRSVQRWVEGPLQTYLGSLGLCHHNITLKIPWCEHSIVVRFKTESGTLWPTRLSFTYIAAETYSRKQRLSNPHFQSPSFVQLHNITCYGPLTSSQASHGPAQRSVQIFRIYHETHPSFHFFLFLISGTMLETCRKKTKEIWDFMLS